MNNVLFRIWLKFYSRIPIHPDRSQCPRHGCTVNKDTPGDHLMICNRASLVGSVNVTKKHDRQTRLLFEDLSKAGRKRIYEPRQREGNNTRPDIRALGRGGGDDLVDVTIVHIFGSTSSRQRTVASYSSLTRHAYARKMAKHKHLLDNQLGGRVVPILMNVAGGWEHRFHAFARTLVRETSARPEANANYHTALFFQRHAIRLICSGMQSLAHETLPD